VSVVTLPRRIETPAPRRVAQPRHRTTAPRSAAARRRLARTSVASRSIFIVVIALALSIAGSMVVANRQVQIHQLQGQLLQLQSTYAQQVGILTNLAAPGQIAEQAGVLHLVDPVSVTQVPSTSLDAPLPLPKFIGSAPVSSRTRR
jgi:cell division protein FtsL